MVSALAFKVLATAWGPGGSCVGPKSRRQRSGCEGWGCWIAARSPWPCCAGHSSSASLAECQELLWLTQRLSAGAVMDGLIAKLRGLFGSPPSAPSVALPLLLPPQSAAALWILWVFCEGRKWHCSHAVQILSRMSDLNGFFCHEHCRNWTGGSFFTHCFKLLSSWQAAPQSPVFALAQGHAANVSLAFTLALWLGHMTPHHSPAPQYVTVPTQSSLCRALL